jgi:murein DD-endopeptidase MepM/ murein hydrolase activator NlpD
VADSTAFWVEENGSSGGYYDQRGRSLRKAFLRSPLNFRRISSRFSHARRHPITRRVVPHHGVDFAADWGTPVVAAADGRVISAAWDGALGRAVRIRHANGWRTIYGHLRGFARGIRPGARVEQNQVIGYVGATGRATGPHLHYTMQRDGVAINPLTFDNLPAEPLAEAFRPNLERALAAWSPVLASVRPEGRRGSVAEAVGPPPRERTGG